MTKTISLPLYRLPNGDVVDLRRVWVVESMQHSSYEKDMERADYFIVRYKENMKDHFRGEAKWLKMERELLIENWNKVLSYRK